MGTITLKNGGAVNVGGKTYIAQVNKAGGLDLIESTRKALNYDANTGNLMDDGGKVIGRVNYRGKMDSDAIPELGELNVSVVLADHYAKGYDLKVVKVANTNKNKKPDWAGGDFIGTRQEFALYLDKK